MTRLMLDLFSGTGGASQAFVDRGWEVVRVELDPKFQPDVVADLATWRWEGRRPDFIWASPPCTEFARESMPWCAIGVPPELRLVHATHVIVAEALPAFWVLENVRGAQRFLGRAVTRIGPFYFWGWFPPFPPKDIDLRKQAQSGENPHLRAAVPYEVSAAIADVVEDALYKRELAKVRQRQRTMSRVMWEGFL